MTVGEAPQHAAAASPALLAQPELQFLIRLHLSQSSKGHASANRTEPAIATARSATIATADA